MKILFLTHSFNSLAQKLFVELSDRGHDISIEFDINDSITEEAVTLLNPDLIIAPFLKSAIPEHIWKNHLCLIVHPGIPGDRGPSSLDWAILNNEKEWGVTVLQADQKMDGGPIWATQSFPMRQATKSSLYRNEVANAALSATLEAIKKVASKNFKPQNPETLELPIKGSFHPYMTESVSAIDWNLDSSQTIARKIRARDGSPGAVASLAGSRYHLYNCQEDYSLKGIPGSIINYHNNAICIATIDGAIWISHLKHTSEKCLKLPATQVLKQFLPNLSEQQSTITNGITTIPLQPITYEEINKIGYLQFDFLNGAMSTEDCQQLLAAYREAKTHDTKVIVLMGGRDFWSNGIHLNQIEQSDHPAQESLANINAMNNLVREIILTDKQITVAAMQGNAGAGGVFLALACDHIWARSEIILNPHYKNIGNLYGSEYWTYLLPQKIGNEKALQLMSNRLPIGTRQAIRLGLIDRAIPGDQDVFRKTIDKLTWQIATADNWAAQIAAKAKKRAADEAIKPLENYRLEEMGKMNLNFFGFDPSYHVARYNFVHKIPKSRTPLYLAKHRNK